MNKKLFGLISTTVPQATTIVERLQVRLSDMFSRHITRQLSERLR